MKIAVIGGAGVRAPLLIGSLAKRAKKMDIGEVAVYDIDPRKIRLLTPLAEALLDRTGAPFKFRIAATPQEAVQGADAVITTIREGFEAGRARDERFCLDSGTIGQETTGAAGFAFACRSIPTLLHCARLTFDANPEAWLLNFTNPAGLATEALLKAGFKRTIGICDSADTGKKYVATFLDTEPARVRTRVAGLNHLSFTTSIQVDGRERLPELIGDEAFLSLAQDVFPPAVVARLGCYLNEYLYYFLLPDEALARMRGEPACRGEQVAEWNAALLDRLESKGSPRRRSDALADYFAYVRNRNETYMNYATGGVHVLPSDDEEGYAGVALDFLDAIHGAGKTEHVFCVPNDGALPTLADDAVVEVTCSLGGGRVAPMRGIALPDEALKLVERVKRYESLAVEAIARRSLDAARAALAAHPLVGDETLAGRLMDGFRRLQPAYFQDWR
ncbi:MAG: 6-phospho-beta-glucosidase [Myxococcales bacterium]|nr:MAG: 6-phospho-beta-glucosidase [Myxococcales bacterium]